MIDSHCHLDQDPLFENLNEVILRSKNAGIKKILTICTTLKSFNNILNIVKADEMIFGSFGIHPHESKDNLINKEIIISNVKNNNKIIGVGETGLDFHYNFSDQKIQIDSFNKHIEAAIELNIPLIVHSRNAEDKTYEILKNFKNKNTKILMHCFTGSTEFAKKLIDLNAYFSASGIITFANSVDLQNTFKVIPNDKLLIETDSPFLAPVPMRGKKNEPSFLKFTLEKLSELKKLTINEMTNVTTNNFNKLFF